MVSDLNHENINAPTTTRPKDVSSVYDKALLLQAVDLFKDAKRGKNKHFNAANRFQKRASLLENCVTLLSGVLSGVLAIKAVGVENIPHMLSSPWLAFLLSVTSTGLMAYQGVKKFHQEERAHRDIGNQFILIARNIEKLIAEYKDQVLTLKEFSTRLNVLMDSYATTIGQAETHSTNDSDFKHALTQEGEGDKHIIEMLTTKTLAPHSSTECLNQQRVAISFIAMTVGSADRGIDTE
jgi:hypothetical protein